MDISWNNIDNLEDYFITYLLYTESKTVSQISKIRNISVTEVNDHLIRAKLDIKSVNKAKVESSKDVLDKFLELGKDARLEFIDELSLDKEKELNFKRELYKRILKEKNADDLIVLIWATGEFKDDRFLKILHPLTNHRHSDIRRITYSAIRKISSPKSKFVLEKGLYDSNPQTRQYCAKALAKVGDDKTVEILQRLIEHKKLNEKEYVIRAYNEAILALKYLTAGGGTMKTYKTLHSFGSDEYIVEKSTFIGYAKPIKSEEEAVEFINEIKKKHKDATHNVWAYTVGETMNIQRYSDDGEPQGTAGIPTLEVIKKEDLRDVVVVVTRYFGGIKLGAGGLVRAYTKGAKVGIEAAQIIEKVKYKEVGITIDYNQIGKVQNEIMNMGYTIKDTLYTDKVQIIVYSREEDVQSLKSKMTDITSGTAELSESESFYLSEKDGQIIL